MQGNFDRIDIDILKILQEDSTRAIKDIAKEVGLSATPTYERIKRLEHDGVIKKYTAVVDGTKIGLDILVYCNITLKEQSKEALLAFETEVSKFPEILEVIGLSGNFDYLLKIVSPDIHAYNNFLMNKFSSLPNVGHFHSNIVLGEIKSNSPLPLDHLRK
jgi:Lrp/AsnC family transcriptional regulator, leucine-responsive regulatory protein